MGKKKYSKRDYEEIFNELLGIEVSWSKLAKEDLTQIAVLFDNPEILIKKLMGDKEDGINLPSMLGEIAIATAGKFDGPIARLLKKKVMGS